MPEEDRRETPRLGTFADRRLRLFGQALQLAYGYSDDSIW